MNPQIANILETMKAEATSLENVYDYDYIVAVQELPIDFDVETLGTGGFKNWKYTNPRPGQLFAVCGFTLRSTAEKVAATVRNGAGATGQVWRRDELARKTAADLRKAIAEIEEQHS